MDSTSLVVSQLTVGALLSYSLQVFKNASWFPILQEDSAKAVKIFFAVITSLCGATGLSYAYDPTAHTLLIQNFSWALVGPALWHWLTQFVMQEGWYQAVFNKTTVAVPAVVGTTGTIAGTLRDPIADAMKAQRVAAAKKKLEDAQKEVDEAQK